MSTCKKIMSGILLSSIIVSNFGFSYVSANTDIPLTNEEKTKIDTEILKLQSNIFNNSKNHIENMISKFKDLANYEETGNSKIEFNLDQESLGKTKANINLNNYSVKNNLINSDISGNIDSKVSYTPSYGSGYDLDIKTFFSLISKDGEFYALLKDLNFKVDNENFKEILDKVNEQFSDGKYLKLPTDENSQMIYNKIKNFNLNDLFVRGEKILSKPLLEAYKKSGDKYLLRPTKYACQTYFSLEKELNFANSWYKPKVCTDTIYKAMLKEQSKDLELYIILGNESNTFGFNSAKKYDEAVIEFALDYNEKSILKVKYIVTPDQEKYKGEGFNFEYIKNNYIKSSLYAEGGDYEFNLDAKLNENNKIYELISNVNFDNDFVGSLTLKDKKINGTYSLKERGYDYTEKNGKYRLKNVYGLKILGNLNSSGDKIEKLNLKFIGTNVKTKKPFLISKIDFNTGNIISSLKINNEVGNITFSGKGKIEEKYFKFDSSFVSDIAGDQKYTGNFNLETDLRDNKNKGILNFDLNDSKKQIFKIYVSNDAKREYKTVEIQTPTEYKEFNLDKIKF